jgi:N-acetylglucosamine-6-phosphate deacetylase
MARPVRWFGQLFTPRSRGLAVVEIVDGRISAITPTTRQPRNAVGGPELRILPGLIDIQVNGAFGHDFSDPAADVAFVSRELPRFGVTAYLPTIISSPPAAYAPCLANIARARGKPGARVLGAHVEGPFLSPARTGTHDPANLRPPSPAEVERWLASGIVRIVTLAPELPGALELIATLRAAGVVPAIGHSDATWAEARAAVEAGASLGTHLFNAMRPIHHREPGIAGYLLTARVPVSVIGDGVHLALETLRFVAGAKSERDLVLITDALAGLGAPAGRVVLAGQELVSDGIVARRPDGTLSGSLLPLNRALGNLVAAGVSPEAAVRAATVNPARVIGSRSLGRIQPGGPATLTIVDDEWDVAATFVGGIAAFQSGLYG